MKKNSKSLLYSLHYSKGTSLLEVLIAAVILGVGLLGIGALQMSALQGASNSEYRGRASDLAWSLADRMRANLPGLKLPGTGINSYISSSTSACPDPSTITKCAMIPGASNASGVVSCTPAQIATYDLWEIRCSNGLKKAGFVDGGVKGELPAGSMFVTSTTAGTLQIEIDWVTRTTDNAAKSLTDRVIMTVIPGTDSGL